MLETSLEHLARADLIRRVPVILEIEYMFKHGLVQETTYQALLKQDRKRLHRLVAEALEHTADANAFAALLAKHWDEAGDTARAFMYYVHAGDQAARVYANTEASSAYQRALELASELELSRDQILHLYIQRGRVYELNAQYDNALENYAVMEAVARTRQDSTLELEAVLARIPIYATPNARFDFEHASILAHQAITRARELNDRAAEAKALWLQMLVYSRANQPHDAIPSGEAALKLARELKLRELTAYALNDLGGVYIGEGAFERGLASLQEANNLWRELDNLPMLADNLSSRASYLIYAGEMNQALNLSDEAYRITDRIGNLWGKSFSLFAVGVAHMERGEFATAIAKMRECIQIGDRAGFIAPHLDTQIELARAYARLGATKYAIELGERTREEIQVFPRGLPLSHAALAEFYAEAGELERAAEQLQNARETLALANNLLIYQMYIERAALILAAARGDWQNVRARCTEFIRRLESTHVNLYLADAWHYHARASFHLGEMTEAFNALARAGAAAQAIGSRWMLWQIHSLRAEMEQARGNSALAEESLAQARTFIHFIAEQTPENLRAGFLNRKDVREVMDSSPRHASAHNVQGKA